MGIISQVENPIPYYTWIQECNFTEVTPELVLARCITGEYECFEGSDGSEVVGIAIVRGYGTMAFIVGAWAKNQLKEFMADFFTLLKSRGFVTVRTSANFNEAAYERLTGLKKLWTVYEGIL